MLLHNSNLWFCRITCGSVSGERGWVWASCVFREWFCGCSHSHHNMWRTAAGGLLWWWWSSQGIESLSCNLPAQHQTTDRQRQISLADVHSGTFSSKRHRYLSQELLEWAKRRVNIEQTLIGWMQTQLQMNVDVALCLLDVKIGKCLLHNTVNVFILFCCQAYKCLAAYKL